MADTQSQHPTASSDAQPRSTALFVLNAPVTEAPAHCLRACLQGDVANFDNGACDWLKGVVAGAATSGSRTCDRGFAVGLEPVAINGRAQAAVEIAGAFADDAPPDPLAAVERVEQLALQLQEATVENEGLAEEVLQNYEQLGLLLDVTNEVAEATRTDDIEKLLLKRVAGLLQCEKLIIARNNGQMRVFSVTDQRLSDLFAQSDPAFFRSLIEEALSSSGVTVRELDGVQVLTCLFSMFEGQGDVVVAERQPGGPDFTSGEMRIAEALLSFGGNIVNNSKLHDRIRRMSLEATRALVYAIDKKDQYTSGHSQRVGFMARITGETMGLPMAELDQLEWSGLLHDIGKIGVPEEILNKPGKLTDEEFDEIKKHPQMGYDILAPIKAFEHILGGVLSHHENEDGSGYPHGLAGDEIPMFARIIHVVDVFDALSSTRSYRKAFTVDKAMDIVLELAEAKMYPPAVSAFKAALDDFRYLQPDAFRAMFYFALADTNDADAGEETSE